MNLFYPICSPSHHWTSMAHVRQMPEIPLAPLAFPSIGAPQIQGNKQQKTIYEKNIGYELIYLSLWKSL